MNKLMDKIELRQGWYWPKSDTEYWEHCEDYPDVPVELSNFVENKGVAIQAGGNVGLYIKEYSKIFNTVYTFEPDPLNFLCLNLNCDTENVIKIQSCLGFERQLHSLEVNDENVGCTHIYNNKDMHPKTKYLTSPLPTLTIDDLGLPSCDLIALDIEGFEYFALLGAVKTIDKCRPVICVEWVDRWAARYDVTLDMIENFLSQFNYKLVAQLSKNGTDRVYVSK
jgi:FkbM family methyltransferase